MPRVAPSCGARGVPWSTRGSASGGGRIAECAGARMGAAGWARVRRGYGVLATSAWCERGPAAARCSMPAEFPACWRRLPGKTRRPHRGRPRCGRDASKSNLSGDNACPHADISWRAHLYLLRVLRPGAGNTSQLRGKPAGRHRLAGAGGTSLTKADASGIRSQILFYLNTLFPRHRHHRRSRLRAASCARVVPCVLLFAAIRQPGICGVRKSMRSWPGWLQPEV